jgi:hypothetical protein
MHNPFHRQTLSELGGSTSALRWDLEAQDPALTDALGEYAINMCYVSVKIAAGL